MSEYKCICCGEVRQSEKSRTCPNCGYKMYPTPYDRKQVLADEINNFLQHLQLSEIKADAISFFRREPSDKKERASGGKEMVVIHKSDDGKRFPNFDTIQSYVCAGKKDRKSVV